MVVAARKTGFDCQKSTRDKQERGKTMQRKPRPRSVVWMLATLTVALTATACRPRVTDRDAETPETQANDRSQSATQANGRTQSAVEEEGTLDPRDVTPVPTQITDDEEYSAESQPNGQPTAEREDTAGDQENPQTENALQPNKEDEASSSDSDSGDRTSNDTKSGNDAATNGAAASSEPAHQGSLRFARQEMVDLAGADVTSDLSRLSDAFRHVAQKIKPSVVQVSVEVRPGGPAGPASARLSPQQLQGLLDQFGPLLDESPELQRFFERRSRHGQPTDISRYNVPLPIGMGSGWVYDTEGHIITNRHVISRADRVKVIFHDEAKASAEVVGSDPRTDVAVLKSDRTDLQPVALAEGGVEQGDIVLAVGSPFRYAFSVSQGIVSATERRMGILGAQGYENFIQTDAAINPGNSGGPVINAQGEVIGMSTAIASRSGGFAGIGFAIPADMIRQVADEIIRTGHVERGYLGVMISDDEELLKTFGVEQGVVVEDLLDDAPADQAGLQAGDVIIGVGEEWIETARQLRQTIAALDPGEEVQLTFLRNGERREGSATLQRQPDDDQQAETKPEPEQTDTPDSISGQVLAKLGFLRLEDLTPQIARRFQLDVQQGILVLGVRPYSAAAVAGIGKGHIIRRVAGERVDQVEQLRRLLQDADWGNGVRLRVKIPHGPARFAVLSLGG